ncbi:MAG: hypothetical protein Kilf2KO_30200 [Rhodospirillales bacterium]
MPSPSERAGDAGPPTAILRRLIARSPYRDLLLPIEAEVIRVALLNRQVRDALESLARSAPERRQAKRVAKAYLEHVAFASPGFLRSVGEWPPGGRRG